MMELQIFKKGATYSADCRKCGCTMYSHEWAHPDNNDRRDALEKGTLRCDECGSSSDPETFTTLKPQYAGRYSAPGYLDCTDLEFNTNYRRLRKTLRELYAE